MRPSAPFCVHTLALLRISAATMLLVGGCVERRDDSSLADEDVELEDTDGDDDPDESDEVEASGGPVGVGALAGDVEPQGLASDPVLRWILVPAPGTARLMTFDPVTQTTSLLSTVNHVSTAWVPVSVAGDKLLWRNETTRAGELWTMSAAGAKISSVSLTSPSPGTWLPRAVSLDQDGLCPPGAPSYTVLWEGVVPPGTAGALWPKPRLHHLDGSGAFVSSEQLSEAYPNAQLRDFRVTGDGLAMLAYRPLFGDGNVTWYQRVGNAWSRLRTDSYSATGGLTGCVPQAPGVLCPLSFVDEAPGAGHKLASVLTTANASPLGGLPTYYHLWTKTDGTAKMLRSNEGPLLAPATPVATNLGAGFSVASFAGAVPFLCP